MRLKDLGYLYSGLTGKSGEDFNAEDSTQGKPFLPFTNVFNNFRVDVADVRYVAMTKGEVQNRVETDDILFLMSSEDFESIGKPSVVSDKVNELYLNSFCRGLRITRPDVCSDYVAYYLNAESVRQVLRLEARGFTRINLKVDRLASQKVLIPALSVQRKIVAYLDGKSAAIDARVAVLEKKLAAYTRLKASVINRAVTRGLDPKAKLKDSGVDWIGKIPVDWAAGRFKDIATVRANLVDPDYYMEYPQVAPENIEKGTGKLLGYGTVRESGIISGNHLFKKGQIIYSKIRPILNKLVVADFDGLCSADMYPIDVMGDLRFVFYQMLSSLFVNQVAAIVGMRVKMPKINQEELSAVGMVIPPITEQHAIADYLDAECAKIDKMAELVTREIELYKKLKRSLINEVVTGKRPVFADKSLRRGKEVA